MLVGRPRLTRRRPVPSAVERGIELGCTVDPDLQPVAAHVAADPYGDEDFARFREAMAPSPSAPC